MCHITGHLRSGILEVEPKTGIHVLVIFWGSALRTAEGRSQIGKWNKLTKYVV